MKVIECSLQNARKYFDLLSGRMGPCHSFQQYEFLLAICAPKGIIPRCINFLSNVKSLVGDMVRRRPTFHIRCFVIVDDSIDYPILIAPLEVSKNSTAMVLGTRQGLNSVDFIYSDLPDNVVRIALRVLRKHLLARGIRELRFGNLEETSRTYGFFDGFPVTVHSRNESVAIEIKSRYEEYFSELSKSVRQNIRTAHNRMERESREYTIEVYSGFSAWKSLQTAEARSKISQCQELYEKRQQGRYGNYRRWFDRVVERRRWWVSQLCFSRASIFVVMESRGRVVAFMHGFVNEARREIYAVRVAIDEGMKWYSPGLIMLTEFIKGFVDSGKISEFDLGCGVEKYKKDLGGKIYYTQDVSVSLEGNE